jgi:TonB family protein
MLVLVDETGNVIQVRQVSEKAGRGLDRVAMDAARRTTWRPATKDGVRVKMWVEITISFRP